ncbi:MAG: transitional endoplasmic reticulum ATPase [Acidobacteriota bacterium]|nr:transitional endoplasmic reticulum ATPase [Acidobacteriota bacterium]
MPVPFKQDDVAERVRADGEREQQKPKSAAGASLTPAAAQEVWPQVLEHKWYMSERLGRDVGLKVAALDYFKNVRRIAKRDELREVAPPALPIRLRLGHR